MNEQEIREQIKLGLKSPSVNFTHKVMDEISTLPNEAPVKNKWIIKALLCVCCLLLILSVFISLPEIHFLSYSISFSPVVMPILCIVFMFVILQQLYELRSLKRKNTQELTTC